MTECARYWQAHDGQEVMFYGIAKNGGGTVHMMKFRGGGAHKKNPIQHEACKYCAVKNIRSSDTGGTLTAEGQMVKHRERPRSTTHITTVTLTTLITNARPPRIFVRLLQPYFIRFIDVPSTMTHSVAPATMKLHCTQIQYINSVHKLSVIVQAKSGAESPDSAGRNATVCSSLTGLRQ